MTTCFVGSVIDAGSWTVSGAADIPSALGDFTDASYCAPPSSGDNSGTLFLRMDEPSFPAYATVKSVTLHARWSAASAAKASILVYAPGIAPYPLAWNYSVPTADTDAPLAPMPLAPGAKKWSPDGIGTMQIQVWAQSPVHLLGLWAVADVDQAPTVTILSPAGDVSASARPVIRWRMFDPEGQGQERAQIRLFTQSAVASATFNPETAVAARSWDVAGAMAELLLEVAPDAYTLYIRASEHGSNGRYGAWSSFSFVVAGATPGTPALAVTPDPAGQRAVLTATRADNLLGYEQASGGDDGSLPTGWWADSNAGAPTSAVAVASGTDGTRVVSVTSLAAGAVSMRAGGPLLTGGTASPAPGGGGSTGTVTVDNAHLPARASNAIYDGADLQKTVTASPGTVLVVLAGLGSWDGGGSVVPSVSDTAGLTWTQRALTSPVGPQEQSAIWTAVVDPARTSDLTTTVTLTEVHPSMKTFHLIPCAGADPTNPVASAGVGSSSGAVSISATAPAAGAIMLADICDYYGIGLPSVGPGTLISTGRLTFIDAAAVSAPAPAAGSTLAIGVSSPTSGVSYTYAWVVLNPAPATAAPSAPSVPATSSVASPWLAGVPVKAGKAYVGVGQAWQAAGATRHARLDVRLYDKLAQVRAVITGTSAATASSAMTSLPATAFTPAIDGVAVLVAVAEDAAGASEEFHFDRLGVGPAGWRWSRGGVAGQNLLGWADSSLIGSPSWGALSATRTFISESTLSGQALQLASASAGGGHAGPAPVPIPNGVSVLSAGCMVKVSDSGVGPCWVSMRWVGADGGTLGWPGGIPVNPKTGGAWTLLRLEGAPVPPGAAAVQITVAGSGALSGGQYTRWAHFGVWASSRVPAAWNTGPGVESYPLFEYSDDGATWDYVRGTDTASYADGEVGVLYDFEICPGLTRQYRASTAAIDYRADPSGVLLTSSPSVPLLAWLPAKSWWLKDPHSPGAPLKLQVAGDLPFGIPARAARFDVLDNPSGSGPQFPKFIYGRRSGREHKLSLIVRGTEDWQALLAMLTPGYPLLLVGDMAEQYWVMAGDLSGTLKSSITRLLDPTQPVDLPLVQIARPSQAARSV